MKGIPRVIIVDRQPDNPNPVCLKCAHWFCNECWDYKKQYANLSVSPSCNKCGGTRGEFHAVRHRITHKHMRIDN